MTTLRQHQQRAARAPRGTKGKPLTEAQLAARRANAKRATFTRQSKAGTLPPNVLTWTDEAGREQFALLED